MPDPSFQFLGVACAVVIASGAHHFLQYGAHLIVSIIRVCDEPGSHFMGPGHHGGVVLRQHKDQAHIADQIVNGIDLIHFFAVAYDHQGNLQLVAE